MTKRVYVLPTKVSRSSISILVSNLHYWPTNAPPVIEINLQYRCTEHFYGRCILQFILNGDIKLCPPFLNSHRTHGSFSSLLTSRAIMLAVSSCFQMLVICFYRKEHFNRRTPDVKIIITFQ